MTAISVFAICCAAACVVFTAAGIWTWDTKNSIMDRVVLTIVFTTILIINVVYPYT